MGAATMQRRIGVGLYWSADGKIACSGHAPAYRSDTWNMERWEPVPVTPATESLACECCEEATS